MARDTDPPAGKLVYVQDNGASGDRILLADAPSASPTCPNPPNPFPITVDRQHPTRLVDGNFTVVDDSP